MVHFSTVTPEEQVQDQIQVQDQVQDQDQNLCSSSPDVKVLRS